MVLTDEMPPSGSWDKDAPVWQHPPPSLVWVAPSAAAQSITFLVYLGSRASAEGIKAVVREGTSHVFFGCFGCFFCQVISLCCGVISFLVPFAVQDCYLP